MHLRGPEAVLAELEKGLLTRSTRSFPLTGRNVGRAHFSDQTGI